MDNNTSQTKSSKAKGGWTAAIFVIFVEMAERFAFYGLASNLITYLTNYLHEPLATAAKNVSTWIGVSFVFPILGAFLADAYMGRFTTILVASVIYFTGMVLLTLSVSVIPTHKREALFFISLYMLAVGEGGHKPCVQTFAADQFDNKAAKSSFFNWWYMGIVVGATTSLFAVIYIEDNVGWTAGLGILAGALLVSFILFLFGIKKYKKQAPVGSPFTALLQVIVAAVRKRRVREGMGICYENVGADMEAPHKLRILARTKQFMFLDKATLIDNIDASSKTRNPWRLCTQNQVEEAKLVFRLIPIWLTNTLQSACVIQSYTFFTKQGSTMRRSIGPKFVIPPASLQGLSGIIIIIAVPIYDRYFVPLARKITGHPSGITMLQRIGVGMFLTILEMGIAALVEAKRVSVAKQHGLIDEPKAMVPMSVWWLILQYVLSGLYDIFSLIGMQELFYDQSPEAMRSMGAAAYVSVTGTGSFINAGLIALVQSVTSAYGKGDVWLGNNLNRAHLDYYYWVLTAFALINFGIYVWIAKGFVYKQIEDDDENKIEGEPTCI